ncbi:MAG: PrsW family intramembrane metalloprotease [bacterium]|nr:PrsW family intramembrane metalloprotease [bacterium]
MLSAGLLSIAIAPSIAISVYIYKKDHTEKESKLHLLLAFAMGMVATLPAYLLSRLFEKKTGLNIQAYSIGTLLTYCIFGIGLIEELSKFIFSKLFYRKETFNQPFDGVIYCVMVAMGFATVENIIYITDGGLNTAILRMFISVPAHAAFGILMGNYMGRAKFSQHSLHFLILSVLIPALYHGFFDFFLIQKISWIISLGAAIIFVHMFKLSQKIIKGQG